MWFAGSPFMAGVHLPRCGHPAHATLSRGPTAVPSLYSLPPTLSVHSSSSSALSLSPRLAQPAGDGGQMSSRGATHSPPIQPKSVLQVYWSLYLVSGLFVLRVVPSRGYFRGPCLGRFESLSSLARVEYTRDLGWCFSANRFFADMGRPRRKRVWSQGKTSSLVTLGTDILSVLARLNTE